MAIDVVVLGSAFMELSPSVIYSKLRNVKQFYASAGGSATNFAVSLSRLGLKVGLISRVGADELGQFVLKDLKEEGLLLKGVKPVKGYRTGISLYEIDPLKRKHYFFYRFPGFSDPESTLKPNDIDPDYIARARAFAFTEASIRREPSRDAVFKAARAANRKSIITLYDPNYRRALWNSKGEARSISLKAIRKADIVTPNESEASLITGKTDPGEICERLLRLGPKVVAIKRGWKGSIVADGNQMTSIPAFKIEVLDDTGAGDAFNAGLLYGLLMDWPLVRCGRFGNAVAALKVGRLGGKGVMPFLSDVERFLDQAPP